ncbi:MAG: hypothetical protein IJG87_01905, partial [Ruminococcus sp.]|nr:hypothetical protein [Ruminococcus sp.]
MIKTSKLISLLLVVAMLLSLFSVAIVSTSAESLQTVTISYDGQEIKAHVGDTIRYRSYMDVTNISTAADGVVNVADGVTYYDDSMLTIVGTPTAPGYEDPRNVMINPDTPGEIWYNDQDINYGFTFNANSEPMLDVTFEITGAGENGVATITSMLETLTKAENGKLKYFYVEGFNVHNQPNMSSTLDVTCPHPTEADEPTQPAGDKATVTIYGLDGKSETKEFNVGDTFTVYTTLNTSAYENGAIGSLN